jgi:nicotinamidase-related amidase
MTAANYDADHTALLVVDPYNDFMSDGGILYDLIKETAEASGLFDNLRKLLPAVRSAGIQVFIVPHHRARDGDFDRWQHMNPVQVRSLQSRVFEAGSWGGEFHPEFGPQKGDVVVHEHWAQSGFANTDLDTQLKQHGIKKIILVGMVANTCIESTGRFGMELGYHVTLVRDATAAFSAEGMHAAHEVNGPTFAHAIATTEELLGQLSRN